jgi:antirestriction protein ArdC
MAQDKKEMYALVTDRLIEMMREGVAPWSKPWIVRGVNDPYAPHNGSTGRYYSGINSLWLGMVAMERGYNDPRWMTYGQMKKLGGTLVDGAWELRVPIVFNSRIEKKDKKTGEVISSFWYLKQWDVFNVTQIDGLDLDPIQAVRDEPIGFDEHDDAQHLADSWLDAEKIPLTHGGDSAFYMPSADRIGMPDRDAFSSPEHYYHTLFHEIVHSSGHEKRQNRLEKGGFGSDTYAREELVAEIGAAMLYATAGLERDLMEHSAAYLKGWASKLEDDPGILFTAANAAQRAAEYITERVPNHAAA